MSTMPGVTVVCGQDMFSSKSFQEILEDQQNHLMNHEKQPVAKTAILHHLVTNKGQQRSTSMSFLYPSLWPFEAAAREERGRALDWHVTGTPPTRTKRKLYDSLIRADCCKTVTAWSVQISAVQARRMCCLSAGQSPTRLENGTRWELRTGILI